eukprot:906568-Pyramimonas_sp.AAC.1
MCTRTRGAADVHPYTWGGWQPMCTRTRGAADVHPYVWLTLRRAGDTGRSTTFTGAVATPVVVVYDWRIAGVMPVQKCHMT